MKRLKKLREVKLTQSEKDQIYLRVLKSVSADSINLKPIKSPYVFLSLFNKQHFKFVTALLLIFIVTSSTAYASRNAMPGDLLYSVKTKVLEKIPDMFAVTSEARAKRSSIKLENRMKEFEALAERGQLNKEKSEVINIKADKELVNFDKNVEKIKDSKKDIKTQLNSDLEVKINEHQENIRKIRENNELSNPNVLERVLERGKSEEKKINKKDNQNTTGQEEEKLKVSNQGNNESQMPRERADPKNESANNKKSTEMKNQSPANVNSAQREIKKK